MDHQKVWESRERWVMDGTFATVLWQLTQLLASVLGEMMWLHIVPCLTNAWKHTELFTKIQIIASQVNPADFLNWFEPSKMNAMDRIYPLFYIPCCLRIFHSIFVKVPIKDFTKENCHTWPFLFTNILIISAVSTCRKYNFGKFYQHAATKNKLSWIILVTGFTTTWKTWKIHEFF